MTKSGKSAFEYVVDVVGNLGQSCDEVCVMLYSPDYGGRFTTQGPKLLEVQSLLLSARGKLHEVARELDAADGG